MSLPTPNTRPLCPAEILKQELGGHHTGYDYYDPRHDATMRGRLLIAGGIARQRRGLRAFETEGK